MRGRVLAFDFKTGEGAISGDDGQRYRFAAADWNGTNHPTVGQTADFETDGNQAKSIYAMAGSRAAPGGKDRVTAALLAFFLGGLGIHKFYLGKNNAGLVMLLVSVFGSIIFLIPTFVIATIAFIEFIIYLISSEEDFQRKYVEGDQSWF